MISCPLTSLQILYVGSPYDVLALGLQTVP